MPRQASRRLGQPTPAPSVTALRRVSRLAAALSGSAICSLYMLWNSLKAATAASCPAVNLCGRKEAAPTFRPALDGRLAAAAAVWPAACASGGHRGHSPAAMLGAPMAWASQSYRRVASDAAAALWRGRAAVV